MKLFKKKDKEEYSETPMEEDDASLPPPPPPPLEEPHPSAPPIQTSQMEMMDNASSPEDRALIRKVTGIKEDGTAADDQPGSTAPNTPENDDGMNPRESFAFQGPAMSGRFRGMRSAQTFDEEEAGMDEIEVPSSSVVTRLSRKEQERAEQRQAMMAKCKKIFMIFGIFVVIAAIVVGSVLGTRGGGKGGDANAVEIEPNEPESAADILVEQNIISAEDLAETDEDSPVYNALKFINESPKFSNANDMKDESMVMEMKQVFAAVTLFNSMKGDGSGTWDNWMTDEPICTWHGIECNEDDEYYDRRRVLQEGGKVTSIDLADNGLAGAIPSQLLGFEHLERLVLFSNGITGELPKELFSLPNLQYLDLDSNNVSGQISPDIGNLEKMEFLYLSNNDITGPIPSEIGKLEEVKGFWLSNNAGITGEIPPEMVNMRSLRDLRLDSLSLTGRIPTTFADLVLSKLITVFKLPSKTIN